MKLVDLEKESLYLTLFSGLFHVFPGRHFLFHGRVHEQVDLSIDQTDHFFDVSGRELTIFAEDHLPRGIKDTDVV
jgi:hypothetical protein